MRVAILKGNRLNEWHLAMYEYAARMAPSDRRLEITAFTTPDNLFDTNALGIDIVRIPYEYEAGPLWRRFWCRWQYRRRHATEGYEFAAYGLEDRLVDFDLIQTWELFTTYSQAAVRAAARGRARLLVTVWDDIPGNYEAQSDKSAIKRAVRSAADGFLVYTEAARRSLVEEGVDAGNIHRVWPSVDLSRFQGPTSLPAELDEAWLGTRPFTVLFAGRLVPEKGIYDLLDAVEPLFRSVADPEIKVIYIGSGRELEPLEHCIRQRGLTGRVRVIRRQHYQAMPDWIRLADVVVLPSRPRKDWREQFGMIGIEALAAGCPLIVSRTPGTEEVLGRAPLFVESGRIEALREALEKLARSPELRRDRAEVGRQWVADHFDQARNAPVLLEIYQKLLNA